MPIADLSLRHLRAIVAVQEHGSSRRAAIALGYSQAAVAQQLAAAERAVGALLFDRPGGPKAMSPTPTGQEVLSAARDILARADQLEATCTSLRDGTAGRLAIGTFQSVSTRLLPQVLSGLHDAQPAIAIDVVESDDNDVLIAHLLSGRLDVTFLVGPVDNERLILQEVCRDPFVAMVGVGRLSANPVPVRDLAGVPLIGHQDCACHVIVREALREAGVETSFVFRSNDNGAVQAMARADLGVAVMPLLAVDPRDPGVRILALEPPLPERQILVALPARRASPTAVEFVGRVMEAVRADLAVD
jgi:DNA-binding transcriptional LysR family regulator